MPQAARINDLCTGHGCFFPRITDEGSPDVFVNNRNQHRQGDHWVQHCCPKHGCHDSSLLAGSPTSYVNNKQRGRVADFVACGSIVATGSPDTRIGPEPSSGPGSPNGGDPWYYLYFRAGYSRAGDRVANIYYGEPPEL
jgi:uncharacterized Zn-binding protein involved in type VI secretion